MFGSWVIIEVSCRLSLCSTFPVNVTYTYVMYTAEHALELDIYLLTLVHFW